MTVCQISPYKPVAPGRTHKQAGSLGGHQHSYLVLCRTQHAHQYQPKPASSQLWPQPSPQPHPPLALPGALLSAKGTCPSPQPRCYRALVSPSPSFQLATLRNSTKSELCQVAARLFFFFTTYVLVLYSLLHVKLNCL